jgi:hypothetical protein
MSEKTKLSNKEIGNRAIRYVVEYLESMGEKPEIHKHGADVVSDSKYIDVKGCLKRETNIRMTQQALDSIGEEGKLKQGSFFIYYIYDMSTDEPKLKILDYNAFKANKIPEIRWVIQHNNIEIKEIKLRKLKFDS